MREDSGPNDGNSLADQTGARLELWVILPCEISPLWAGWAIHLQLVVCSGSSSSSSSSSSSRLSAVHNS
jgi:hypothetical protein